MFQRKKRFRYQKVINAIPIYRMQKPKPQPKLTELLETMSPPTERQKKQRTPFQKNNNK